MPSGLSADETIMHRGLRCAPGMMRMRMRVQMVAIQATGRSLILTAFFALTLPLAGASAMAAEKTAADECAATIIEKNVFQPARVRQFLRFFPPTYPPTYPPVATSQPTLPTIQRSFRVTGLAPDGQGGWHGLLELENPSERRWVTVNDKLEAVIITAVDQKWLTLAAGNQTIKLGVGDDSSRLSAKPVTIEEPFILRGLYVSGSRKRAMLTLGEQPDESNRHIEIKPGDRLAGGVVKDITDQELLLERDGTTYKLRAGARGGGGRHRTDGN